LLALLSFPTRRSSDLDAMRSRDTTLLRSTFAPGAQLSTVGTARDGTLRVSFEKPDGFVQAVARPSDVVWDERTYNPEVRIDQNLATVWMEYDFYAGTEFSHCGVEAFQLAKLADGWKIIALADTRQREGCPTCWPCGSAGGTVRPRGPRPAIPPPAGTG